MRSSFTAMAMALALALVTVTAFPAKSFTLDDKTIIDDNSIDSQMGIKLYDPQAPGAHQTTAVNIGPAPTLSPEGVTE